MNVIESDTQDVMVGKYIFYTYIFTFGFPPQVVFHGKVAIFDLF